MRLRLKFNGPNVISTTTKVEPIPINHAISFAVDLVNSDLKALDAQRFFEMERTFNELTRGRLHVELVP